jgi:hypothetical protein
VLVDELPAAFAARSAVGWDECLDRLLGTGATGRSGGWREPFAHYVSAFEPVLGPQAGPPPGISPA